MTYKIRRSDERKYFDHGWLKTLHTFSFGSYYDSVFMGFRSLRVINEDRVDPGHGFPPHDHENMEIISIVLEGELAHRDSMGTESIIRTNEIQQMSAGTGVTHSEYNPSSTDSVHFLQIWIIPDTQGIAPRYQQKSFPPVSDEWQLIASKNGKNNSIKIQQDMELYAMSLAKEKHLERQLAPNRYGWLQVVDGELAFNDDILHTGDGVAIDRHTSIKIKAKKPSRILFFDLN